MFIENVIAYCERNEITMKQFEQMCELANGSVSRWKLGKCSPTLKTLERIEKRTSIPIERWIK